MRSILTAATFSVCFRARQKDVKAFFVNNVEGVTKSRAYICLKICLSIGIHFQFENNKISL